VVRAVSALKNLSLARLHPDHRRIASGAFRVAVFLLLGKALGAVKEMAVAWRYGVSDVVDAYQFTLTLTTWLPVTLTGVLAVVLIPVLVKVKRAPHAERWCFLRELSGLSWLLAAGVSALTWLAWPWVLQTLGSGLSPDTRAMTHALLAGFAPVAGLTLLAGISAARLRAHERHINTLLDSVPALAVLACVLLWTQAGEVFAHARMLQHLLQGALPHAHVIEDRPQGLPGCHRHLLPVRAGQTPGFHRLQRRQR